MDAKSVGIRHHYLDEYTTSKLLKYSLMRIKPLEIAQLTCYDPKMMSYGEDREVALEALKKYNGSTAIPEKLIVIVKVFNFSEGKTAFNMNADEKVLHA